MTNTDGYIFKKWIQCPLVEPNMISILTPVSDKNRTLGRIKWAMRNWFN